MVSKLWPGGRKWPFSCLYPWGTIPPIDARHFSATCYQLWGTIPLNDTNDGEQIPNMAILTPTDARNISTPANQCPALLELQEHLTGPLFRKLGDP